MPHNDLPSNHTFSVQPIGLVASDYSDKFGIPRQPGLARSARAIIYLIDEFDDPLAVDGLSEFSHLWLNFLFHQSPTNWQPRVRPPRLGGNQRIGVFASRSTHRPNRLGQSLVQVEHVEIETKPSVSSNPIHSSQLAAFKSRVKIHLRGHDLVDGTPIIDIKPYLPWAESVADASAGYSPEPPIQLRVEFAQQAAEFLSHHEEGARLKSLITEILAQDPRPAYKSTKPQDDKTYGVSLSGLNVRFCVESATANSALATMVVIDIEKTDDPNSQNNP